MNAPRAPLIIEVAKRHAAEVQRLRRGPSIADQNSKAARTKVRCCATCQASDFRARSKREGKCHIQSAAPCTAVATQGSDTRVQRPCTGRLRPDAASARRADPGNAQSHTPNG